VRARIFARLTRQEEGLGYHNVAKVLNWAGKREDAARIAQRGLALDTVSLESIWSSLFVGAELEREGRSEQALPYYRRALRLDPGSEEALRLLGEALERLGRSAEAQEYLSHAGGNDPENLAGRERLGRIAYGAGRFPEAVSHLRVVTSRDPGNVELRLLIAGALMSMNDPVSAGTELRGLVAVNPNAADAWMGLGIIAESQGKTAEAIQSYSRAIKIQPNFPQAQSALARLLGGAR
jgi:tetratricopeptide (TPR) repeat protein